MGPATQTPSICLSSRPLTANLLSISRGRLVYVSPDHGHPNHCTPDCRYACQPFADADPPFRVDPSGGSTGGAGPVGPANALMLVDRGPRDSASAPCKFAEKVWNAQQAGAAGVLVVNFEDKHTTMEAPDDQDEV